MVQQISVSLDDRFRDRVKQYCILQKTNVSKLFRTIATEQMNQDEFRMDLADEIK